MPAAFDTMKHYADEMIYEDLGEKILMEMMRRITRKMMRIRMMGMMGRMKSRRKIGRMRRMRE